MERSIAIHWFPIQGADEYYLRLESRDDRRAIGHFSGPPGRGLVESCRVRLPPGRYVAALLARIPEPDRTGWERHEREFSVEPVP